MYVQKFKLNRTKMAKLANIDQMEVTPAGPLPNNFYKRHLLVPINLELDRTNKVGCGDW